MIGICILFLLIEWPSLITSALSSRNRRNTTDSLFPSFSHLCHFFLFLLSTEKSRRPWRWILLNLEANTIPLASQHARSSDEDERVGSRSLTLWKISKEDRPKKKKKKEQKEKRRKERERKRDIGSARETGRFSGNSIALLRVLCATYSGERIMAVSCADFQPLLEMKNPGTPAVPDMRRKWSSELDLPIFFAIISNSR